MKKNWKDKVGYNNPLRTAYDAYLKTKQQHSKEENQAMEACAALCLDQIKGAKTILQAIAAFDAVCFVAWRKDEMSELLKEWASQCRTPEEARSLWDASEFFWNSSDNPARLRWNRLRRARVDAARNLEEVFELFEETKIHERGSRPWREFEDDEPADRYAWSKLLAACATPEDLRALRMKLNHGRQDDFWGWNGLNKEYRDLYVQREKELSGSQLKQA